MRKILERVNMEKKRSKGVTFWGWIFIIFAIIGLLSARSPQQLYGLGIVIYGVVSSLAYLICGIYILKLNEKARKAIIILGIISIVLTPLLFKPMLNIPMPEDIIYDTKAKQRIMERLKPEYQQKALEDLENSNKITRKVLPIIFIVIFGVPMLILELAPIYFFTRPKVKEQFK